MALFDQHNSWTAEQKTLSLSILPDCGRFCLQSWAKAIYWTNNASRQHPPRRSQSPDNIGELDHVSVCKADSETLFAKKDPSTADIMNLSRPLPYTVGLDDVPGCKAEQSEFIGLEKQVGSILQDPLKIMTISANWTMFLFAKRRKLQYPLSKHRSKAVVNLISSFWILMAFERSGHASVPKTQKLSLFAQPNKSTVEFKHLSQGGTSSGWGLYHASGFQIRCQLNYPPRKTGGKRNQMRYLRNWWPNLIWCSLSSAKAEKNAISTLKCTI